MTGGTHVAIGIASSLAILQPQTVPECLCAITGGMIGGMISDIDSPGKRESMDYSDDPYGWQVYSFVGIAIVFLLGIDFLAGDGAVDYFLNNLSPYLLVGAAAFIGILFYGAHTNHRTFMHSILAGILLGASVWCFCRPLVIPFVIGFATHLFIDFFNKRKVQYFWPIPWKIGLNKYPSDGKLNESLSGIGTIASVYLFLYFFIRSFANSFLFIKALELFSQPVTILGKMTVPFIIPYLVVINIVGFIIYILDYNLYMRGLGFYKGSDEDAGTMSEYIMTLLLIIDAAGGMIGKLLAVLILKKGKIFKAEALANYNLYVIPVCFLISWMAFLFTFFFPFMTEWVKPMATISINGIPAPYLILIYFLIINIVTMILFPRMKRFAYVITPREKVCMILSLFGGATGGYLSMKVTGNHENAVMLANTLPEMMVMHAVVITCIFYVV